jgi:hypothetical protein
MTDTEIAALVKTTMESAGYLTKQEFNGTAAMIRQMNETVTGLKAVNPFDSLVTAGILEKKPDGTYGPKSATPAKKDEAVPEWQRQIDELRSQGVAKDKALQAERDARAAGELKSAVVAAFGKAGAVNPERDYVHVLPSVVRGEDGTFHTVNKDQFGVETKVPLADAFTAFLKSNPELQRAAGRPGSGTPNGGNGTGGSIVVPRAQLSDPAWYQANRAKVISGEIQVAG